MFAKCLTGKNFGWSHKEQMYNDVIYGKKKKTIKITTKQTRKWAILLMFTVLVLLSLYPLYPVVFRSLLHE